MALLTFTMTLMTSVFAQTAAPPARVAVVSIPAISEKYQKTADQEARFDAIRRKLSQDRDARKDKIERLKRSLQEELKPGTDEYAQRRQDLAVEEALMQSFVEYEGQKVDRGLGDSLREIYQDIQASVREVAEEKGYDIILASDQLPDVAPDSAQQVRQQILLQKVIYWNPRVDLTGDVVARLNERYKAQQPKSDAPPTAPPPAAPKATKAPK